MQIDVSRFTETFFEEAAEHVRAMEDGLLRLETTPGDRTVVDEVFRGAHSIKGGAATFGLSGVARFTHGLEGLLDRVRDGRLAFTPELANLVLRAVDLLKALLAAGRQGIPEPEGVEALLEELTATHGSAPVGPAGEAGPTPPGGGLTEFRIHFAPLPDLFRGGMDPVLLARELALLGDTRVEADWTRLPALDLLDPERCHLSWTWRVRTRAGEGELRDVFAFVEDVSELRIDRLDALASAPHPAAHLSATPTAAASPALASAGSTSLRVATEKVDRIINLVGELVIAQAMILQASESPTAASLARLRAAALEMERNTRELQERVMAIRMVPVSTVFSRFPRLVRDLSQSLGKAVELVLEGQDTELDKSVVERLADPLTHLVRNALDHGVEDAPTRAGAGKPEAARLTLRAFHQGGSVVVEVEDDGRGLDLDRIRAQAVERGLLAPDARPSDEELHALIFQPGFSTAARVSDVSGRGVGMDVVKSAVEGLSGSLGVHSSAGAGTRVRLTLPLTLAILDGMSLRVGTQVFVLPIHSIVESFRPRPEELRRVAGGGELVRVRGEPLPLVHLQRVLGVEGEPVDPVRGLVVIVETGTTRFGMVVSELLSQSQVVIKSLDTHYRRVDGVMGATILGDGTVSLLLDPAGLARMAGVDRRAGARAEAA